jgi:hypothetical protein
MGTVILDAGTIRTAAAVLDPDRAAGEPLGPRDVQVATVGQLVEALVLFEEIAVPEIDGPHGRIPHLVRGVGEAVVPLPVPEEVTREIKRAASGWLASHPRLSDLVQLVDGAVVEFTQGSAGGSVEYTVLEAFGVRDKYSPHVRAFLELGRSRPVGPEPRIRGVGWRNSPRSRELPWEPTEPPSKKVVADGVLGKALAELGLPGMVVGWEGQPETNVIAGAGCGDDAWSDNAFVALCANLAWSVWRTRCYDLVAQREGHAYLPHTLRARLAGYSALSPEVLGDPPMSSESTVARRYLRVLSDVHDQAREVANEELGVQFMPLRCSVLLPYVVRKAANRDRVLDVAYEVRDRRGARALRRHTSEMQERLAQGDLKASMALVREMNRLTVMLRRDLGLDKGPVMTMAVSVPFIGQVESPIAMPASVAAASRALGLGRARTLFLRDVFHDLALASQLGDVYDILIPPRSP